MCIQGFSEQQWQSEPQGSAMHWACYGAVSVGEQYKNATAVSFWMVDQKATVDY